MRKQTMLGKKKKHDPSAYKEHSFIGNQTRLVGDVFFSGALHVEGRIEGNLHAQEGCLNLHGEIRGNIDVPHAIINGTVHGDITCLQHLELAAGARVHGVVTYVSMEMALGAQVHGQLQPAEAAVAPAPLE